MGRNLKGRSLTFWLSSLGLVMVPSSLSDRMGSKGLWSRPSKKLLRPSRKNRHLLAAQAAAVASPSMGA